MAQHNAWGTQPQQPPGDERKNQWNTQPNSINHESGSSDGVRLALIVTIVALVVVLIAAVAAGGWFYLRGAPGSDPTPAVAGTQTDDEVDVAATAEESAESTEGSGTADGDCSLKAIQRDAAAPELNTIKFCDGQWMRAGQENTDDLRLFKAEQGRWSRYEADDVTFTGFPCYHQERLDTDSVPLEARGNLTMCQDEPYPVPPHKGPDGVITVVNAGDGSWIKASEPACAGDHILIVDSVVDEPGVDTEKAIVDALKANPDADYTFPGQCPSLREKIDGNDIYPIYINFGDDRRSLCTAKQQVGGNARTLNTSGDFSDPC